MNKIINLYDESIFSVPLSRASILHTFDGFRVNNKVDAWLLREKHDKGWQIIDPSQELDNPRKILNINPTVPYPGINLYTINARQVDKTIALRTYAQIQVIDNDFQQETQLLELTEFLNYDPHKSLAINSHKLSSLESALLIKYYAINYKHVVIDRPLYSYICKEFVDNRAWFRRADSSKSYSSPAPVDSDKNRNFQKTNRLFTLY